MITCQRIAGASALAVLVAAAQGAPFSVLRVAAGGQSGGNPITWTGSPGTPYNNGAVAGLRPPSGPLVFAIPAARFDTFVALDQYGPSIGVSDSESCDAYNSNAAILLAIDTTVSTANQVVGGWWSGAPISSGTDDAVFILSLSLRPGNSAPTSEGVLVTIVDERTPAEGVAGVLQFGSENASDNGGLWAQAYYLDTKTATIAGVNANFNGGTQYGVFVKATGSTLPSSPLLSPPDGYYQGGGWKGGALAEGPGRDAATDYVPGPCDYISPFYVRVPVNRLFMPRWMPASSADSYKLTISTTPDLLSPVIVADVPHVFGSRQRASIDISSLQTSRQYYWGVEAVNQFGSTACIQRSWPVVTAPTCDADFVRNSLIDTADLAALLGAFGQATTPFGQGDATGDGLVDTRDLAVLLGDFGKICGP